MAAAIRNKQRQRTGDADPALAGGAALLLPAAGVLLSPLAPLLSFTFALAASSAAGCGSIRRSAKVSHSHISGRGAPASPVAATASTVATAPAGNSATAAALALAVAAAAAPLELELELDGAVRLRRLPLPALPSPSAPAMAAAAAAVAAAAEAVAAAVAAAVLLVMSRAWVRSVVSSCFSVARAASTCSGSAELLPTNENFARGVTGGVVAATAAEGSGALSLTLTFAGGAQRAESRWLPSAQSAEMCSGVPAAAAITDATRSTSLREIAHVLVGREAGRGTTTRALLKRFEKPPLERLDMQDKRNSNVLNFKAL